MDPTTRYTVQERGKIVEAYFATKSVVLTQRQIRRDFPGRNHPSKLTIRRLLEKVRETGSVGDKNKGHSGRPRSARTAGRISPGKVPPELSLSEGYRFRCKICLHNLSPLLHSVSSCWVH